MTDAGIKTFEAREAAPAAASLEPPRDWWQATKRGFWGRCPHCNEGRLFRAYLKPVDACENCGEEFHHHRADDAPPYVTIMFVGHIVGAAMLFAHERDMNLSVWTEAILWPLVGLVLSLWFLPRFKGALIAYQWALKMHGFATASPLRPASRIPAAVTEPV